MAEKLAQGAEAILYSDSGNVVKDRFERNNNLKTIGKHVFLKNLV